MGAVAGTSVRAEVGSEFVLFKTHCCNLESICVNRQADIGSLPGGAVSLPLQ